MSLAVSDWFTTLSGLLVIVAAEVRADSSPGAEVTKLFCFATDHRVRIARAGNTKVKGEVSLYR